MSRIGVSTKDPEGEHIQRLQPYTLSTLRPENKLLTAIDLFVRIYSFEYCARVRRPNFAQSKLVTIALQWMEQISIKILSMSLISGQ